MTENIGTEFGEIAISLNLIDDEHLEKALVVQKRIFQKTQVSMPIGDVLIEMGALTKDEKKEILKVKREIVNNLKTQNTKKASKKLQKKTGSASIEDGQLDIFVSKDKLTAYAQLFGSVPSTEFDLKDVKVMLHSEEILYGVSDDNLIKAFLNGEFCIGEPWVIATGTEPVPEPPPQILYHFDTDPIKAGTLMEDGLMDWKERGRLPQVKEGELLAEKIPGSKGKEGMDVYGNVIPIPKPKEIPFKCGKGARRSADGKKVHASTAGIPKLSLQKEVSVMAILHIQGDICLETGHVIFDGHIEVAGTIEKGYRVKGGSLRAKEIRDADIQIDGDVAVINGIFGAVIRSNGNLKVGHINNADIISVGDISVEKEIIESTIDANGRCIVKDGIILSSSISAKMGIVAMDIGTQAAKPSELVVGIDKRLERESDTIKSEIQRMKAELENLPEQIKFFKQRSDQVNTTLGEVAQEQDKCMVKQRRLQEKVEAGMLKQGGAAAEKLQHNIEELTNKQDGYDLDVARLMEEDESIGNEIAASEKVIIENTSTIENLKDQLEVVIETQKTDCGFPTVKIGGNICTGTKVIGPNSVFMIDKDLSRLSIVETNRPALDGIKRRRFELCSY